MSSSIEPMIWGAEAPRGEVSAPHIESVRDRIAIVQPIPDNFYARCSAHQITHCMVCSMKERAAAEAAPIPTASQTALSKPMPFLPATTVAPPPEAEPPSEIVAMAQEFAAATQRLQREQNLLVAAELRVESLKESIATLKLTTEETRSKLVKLISQGEDHDDASHN